MRSFNYSEHIARRPDEVFSWLTDYDRDPRWRSLVRKVEIITPPPFGVGSKLLVTLDVMGKIHQATSDVWAFDPPRRFGLRNTANGVTGVFEYTLESEGDGTRIRLTCDIQPHGMMWLVLPWLLKGNRARYREQLQRLKRAMEAATP